MKKLAADSVKEKGSEIVDLKNKLNVKAKRVSELEKDNRQLGAKVAELEAAVTPENKSLEEKYKSVNNNLTSKIKELKKTEGLLKKSENRVKELLSKIESQGKKISEGETYIRRLETRNNQHKEI